MHVFHPRLQLPGFQLDEPQSEWAKLHAISIKDLRENILNVSDSRSALINFLSLQKVVENTMGQTCAIIEWVNEGGANQIYLATFSNNANVLARLSFPFPHAEYTGKEFAHQEEQDRRRLPHRLQPEVGTIRYVSMKTTIPVATVYAFDNDLNNSVGTPYMLQQLLDGDCLANRWLDMTLDQRNAVVKALGSISGQLYACTFENYGSINMQMSIGPIVEPIPSLHRHHSLQDCGPWPSTEPNAPIYALVQREYQWLSSGGGQQLFSLWRAEMHPLEDIEATRPIFLHLAATLIECVAHLDAIFPIPTQASRPALSHADFHFSNILVSRDDPMIVTGVVDWEFAAVLPLWESYDIPDKLNDFGDELEKDADWREKKKQWRSLYFDAVVAACPDAIILDDPSVQQSIRGRRLFKKLSTSGVSLYQSCNEVRALLLEMRNCIVANDAPGTIIFDGLISSFSKFA